MRDYRHIILIYFLCWKNEGTERFGALQRMIALHTSIIRLVFGWVVSDIITEGPLRTLPEQKKLR